MLAEDTAGIAHNERIMLVLIAYFHGHPHICNVLSHIGRGRWDRVEVALAAILKPRTVATEMSPLALNLLELMCAEKGVTGQILKPLFQSVMHAVLEPRGAQEVLHSIAIPWRDTSRQ